MTPLFTTLAMEQDFIPDVCGPSRLTYISIGGNEEDHMGCDSYAHYFRANCPGVSYSEVLSQPFVVSPL